MTASASLDPKHISPFQAPLVRTGLSTGVALSFVMTVSLYLANRVPPLERFATERNSACSGIFFVVMLIPAIRFRRRPVELFTSGMLAWVVFTLAYVGAANFYDNLYESLHTTPGIMLAYGAGAYGIVAVVSWVLQMIRSALREAPTPTRRRPRHFVHPHR
ncbi:MAG: hypothetical protein ACRD4K_03500 [Candidatus Acidiferrales bacterium]